MAKRSKRFQPFGGNKKSGKRNAEIREHLNKIHELEQAIELERMMRRSSEDKLKRYDAFPHAILHEMVRKIGFVDAISLGIDKQLGVVWSWMRGDGADHWNEQITRNVRAVMAEVASGKEASRG